MAFLRLNRTKIKSTQDDLYDLVIGVAEGRISKAAVAVFFEQHTS
jgi:prophage maintenance system killer protein